MTLELTPASSRRPATSSTDFLENAIRASPSRTSSGNTKGLSSQISSVFRSYRLTS